ncbi:FMN-dependent NADH-azoreductase 1 [compost metagenome]
MSFNYVRNIMSFFGVTQFVNVIVEGHNQLPDQAETIIANGIAEAEKAAVSF